MKSFIHTIANKVGSRAQRLVRFRMAPRRHWRILVHVFVVLGVVSVALHSYLFSLVEKHRLFEKTAVVSKQTETVSEEKLGQVLERFEGKALIRASALELVPAVKEPSR